MQTVKWVLSKNIRGGVCLEITFLGTAGDFTSLKRNSPSIAVKSNKWIVLLDCGEGTSRQFARTMMNFALVHSIFITHMHFDHFLGLPAFLFKILLQNGNPPSIFVPYNSKEITRWLIKSMPRVPRIQVNEINCSKRIGVAGLEVSCTSANHGNQAIAYCLTDGLCKLVYTGDTRPCASVEDLANGADILIHDCTFGDSERKLARQTGHSTASEAGEIAEAAGVKMLILVHIGEQYEGRERVLVKQAQVKYKGKIVVARDLLNLKF